MIVEISIPNRNLAILQRLARENGVSVSDFCQTPFFEKTGCNTPPVRTPSSSRLSSRSSTRRPRPSSSSLAGDGARPTRAVVGQSRRAQPTAADEASSSSAAATTGREPRRVRGGGSSSPCAVTRPGTTGIPRRPLPGNDPERVTALSSSRATSETTPDHGRVRRGASSSRGGADSQEAGR